MADRVSFLATPFGGFADGVFTAFINTLLPLYLITFTHNTGIVGLVVTISIFEGALVPLLIGPLSDKLKIHFSIFTTRKLFIVSGMAISIFCMVSAGYQSSLVLTSLFVILAGLGRSIETAPFMALLTLNSTKKTRGVITAFFAVFGLLGQITLTILMVLFWSQEIQPITFITISFLFFLPNIAVLIFSKDTAGHINTKKHSITISQYIFDKKRFFFIVSQIFLWFGVNSVVPFFTLFMKEYMNLTQQQSLIFYLIIIITSGIFTFPFAVLGKYTGETKAYLLGMLFFFISSLLGFFAKSLPTEMLYLVSACAGLGFASASVYSFSLLTKLAPSNTEGMTGGIQACIMSLLAPIAAYLTGQLINIFNYPSMFLVLCVMTILSTFFLLFSQRKK
jgi:MFS family permease